MSLLTKTDGYQRSEERAARKYSDYGFVLALICVALICLLYPTAASAWGYKGHRVVGSIADQMLHDNAKAQVSQILSYEDSPDQGVAITLRIAGPWADCVKSVVQIVDSQGNVTYSYEPSNPEFRIPCTSFEKTPTDNSLPPHPMEQARMEDYVGRNWLQCSYAPGGKERGCHNTYHFDDVAFQRDRFDRSYLGTNEHDLVAAITAAIAMLKDNKAPAPFSIKDKKEALFMLAHFVGDLHQPLHVESVYLAHDNVPGDNKGRVDPDATHQIDPESVTEGGNLISVRDQCLMSVGNRPMCLNFHAEWDENPKNLDDAATPELLTAARSVPPSKGPVEDWPAAWASDTIVVAHQALDKDTKAFTPTAPEKWTVTFDDRNAYLSSEDTIKLQQLAKAGARLAELLNTIWP